ncbi:MAG: proline--tRNA ligase [Candidatus Latescibacteria bacterium]|nr:proline--tRNA ligase [Candidatus Latescibacterota bacterium]
MAKTTKNEIAPTRAEDFPNWYQAVVKEADLAEMAHVRGCMVIKPWGYGIWEQTKACLDEQIKKTGHENVYFPLLIPLDYLEKEAEHVEGFAKEMAVVTHHRLVARDGRLVPDPDAQLDTPLVIRPTSETVIGASFADWIQSYRDLPLKINQWANIVRWEMRPRVFLRTAEFLWQEGHTAHATEEEALQETRAMLEMYRGVLQDKLAIPVIAGEKPASERFPGAVSTLSVEAMMQDYKALQAGTSHYLGQNFAAAAGISFADEQGQEQLVYTTSWGVSTRLIGGVIMTHADDNGLRVPPKISPYHVVVVPFHDKDGEDPAVSAYIEGLVQELGACFFDEHAVRVHADTRPYRAIDKRWQWVKKGVPIILEVGRRDMEGDAVSYFCRHRFPHKALSLSRGDFVGGVGALLAEIQGEYYAEASERLQRHTRTDVADFEALCDHFEATKATADFVRGLWCESPQCEQRLQPLAVSIRCLPFEQERREGACLLCGAAATKEAVFARSY